MYEVTYSPTNFRTDIEWQSALEVAWRDSSYSQAYGIIFSIWKLWLGTYGPVIKSMIYKQLYNNTIQLIDISSLRFEP